ncbi:hypothetical protein B0G77_4209 [Paraburkholderia sp. BL10I2N1]|nr:hypothetical protein B0G77_4209 [Paraburkholderia sp. BL10I2N1]
MNIEPGGRCRVERSLAEDVWMKKAKSLYHGHRFPGSRQGKYFRCQIIIYQIIF